VSVERPKAKRQGGPGALPLDPGGGTVPDPRPLLLELITPQLGSEILRNI